MTAYQTLPFKSRWVCLRETNHYAQLLLLSLDDHYIHYTSHCVYYRFSFDDPTLPIYREYDPVSIVVNQSGLCSAFAIWWSVIFAPGVELSMSPWQQNFQVI